jgi:hypothetical protein
MSAPIFEAMMARVPTRRRSQRLSQASQSSPSSDSDTIEVIDLSRRAAFQSTPDVHSQRSATPLSSPDTPETPATEVSDSASSATSNAADDPWANIVVPEGYGKPAPERFMFDCKWYVPIKSGMSKKGRSKAWLFGEEVCEERSPGKRQWFCHGCNKRGKMKLLGCQSTTSILRHLVNKHNVGRKVKAKQSPLTAHLQQSQNFFGFDLDRFRWLLIRWIVFCHIAFYQLENDYFRELLAYFNPKMSLWVPQAATTIRKWVMDEYNRRKAELKAEIAEAHSKISISFDG